MGISGALGYGAPVAPQEEEYVPPPVAQAPPPPSGGISGALGYGQPAPAPAPAPSPSAAVHEDEYFPAPTATYAPPQHPPGGEFQTTQAQPTPTPDNRNTVEWLTQDVIPQAISDAGKSVEEFRAQPTLKDKAGQLIGAFNVLPDKATGRVEQRVLDRAFNKDPDATLGGMGLDRGIQGVLSDPAGSLQELPEAVGEIISHPENIIDSMAMDVAESPGGLDQSKQSLTDWAATKSDAELAALAKQGEGALTQQWKEETGRTLASGGILGALSGAGYDIGTDPSTPISLAAGGGAGLAAKGASLAGKEGIARGIITKVDPALQTAIDPLGMMAETGVRKVVGRATGGLTNLTNEAKQAGAVDVVNETAGGVTSTIRAARNVGTLPNASQTQNLAPQSDVVPTQGQGQPTTPVGQQITPESWEANGSAPPAPVVPQSTTPLPRVQVPPPPKNGKTGAPFGMRSNGTATPADKLPLLMRDASKPAGQRWVHPNGQVPTLPALRQAWKALEDAPPEAMKGFDGRPNVLPGEETVYTQYLAAYTERGLVYDDWPKARKGGTPEQRKAGENWIRLFAKRIENHRAPEVQRLLEEYQLQQTMPSYINDPKKKEAYWEGRANAIIEAAREAKFDTPFTLTRRGKQFTYTPDGGSTAQPMRGGSALPASQPIPTSGNPIQETLDFFSGADASTQRTVASNLERLMADSDGFGPKFSNFRKSLYKSGAWSKDMKANPDGYARYQSARNSHDILHGGAPASSTLARRGTAGVFGSLAPQEQQIAGEMAAQFRAHLDSLGLSHVHLGLVDFVTDTRTMLQQDDLAGFDPENMNIDLAVARTYQEVKDELGPGWSQRVSSEALDATVRRALYQSLNHEAMHALRNAGVITPDEWRLLAEEARARGYGRWADSLYNDLAPAGRDEEAIAEMFGDFALDQKALSPVTRTIFQKIVDFFTGLVRAVGSVPNGEDVMRKVLSGDIGSRAPVRGGSTTVPMAQRYTGTVYHGSPWDGYTSISASPERRRFDWASSRLGAFFSENVGDAKHFAGPRSDYRTLYEASLELKNPHEMPYKELAERFFSPFPEDIDAALKLRSSLEAAGHDGILVRGDNGELMEIISFNDVPVASARKFRRSSKSALTEADPLFDMLPFTEGQKGILRNTITYKGKANTNLYHVNKDVFDEVEELRFLAQQPADKLSTKQTKKLSALKKQFDAYEPRYDWADPKFTDLEADRIITAHTTKLWEDFTFPNAPKKASAVSGVGQLISDTTAFRRSVGLTNWAAAPRQFIVQLFGNVMMDAIAKPESIVTMFKPRSYFTQFRAQRKGTLSDVDEFFQRQGFGVNAQINTGAKSLAKHQTKIQNETLRKIKQFLAPDFLGDFVSTPDGVHRGGIARTQYLPAMKREIANLPKKAGDTFTAYRTKGLNVDPKAVQKATQDAIKKYKKNGSPISDITGVELQKELYDAFKGVPGIDGNPTALKALRDASDRVARDFNTVRNTNYQKAARESKRVAFSWDNTNLDQIVSNVFLYHYWSSRATYLYAKEMAKKPWMAAAMIGIVEQLQQEAEQGDYPEWMKGFTRLLNSPGGVTLLFNPIDAISTMGAFAEWQYGQDFGEAMKGDLTALGALRGILPMAVAPWADFGAWLTGLYGGEDARVPYNLTGLDQITRGGAQLLNLAGYAGLLPAGMGRDAQGNFRPYAETPLTELAQRFGSAFFGRAPIDLYAGSTVKRQMYLQQILLDDHPEWATSPDGENELTRTMNEMLAAAEAGDVTPEVLEAERMMVDETMIGPDFAGLPEPLRGIFGGVVRAVSPLRTISEPEIKTQIREGSLQIGTTDDYDQKDVKGRPYATLDAALLKAQNEDWWDIGTDTGIKDAAQVFNAIGKATIEQPITIYGKTYTKAMLQDGVMSEGQRYDLAEQYLASQGLTRQDLDAYYTAREEMEQAHPDLLAYHEFTNYLKEYPGGSQAFIDAAVRTSPSYARYMQQLPYPPGTEDYYALGDTPEAFLALEGRQGSVYDPNPLPDKGTVPGLPAGMTFAMQAVLEDNADAAASSGGGDGTSYDDFVGDVQKSVDNLYYSQQLIDSWFPGAGYIAGVTYFDKSTYYALKDAGYNAPDKGDIAYEYLDWLLANPTAPDPSVKGFLNQREQTGPGKKAEMPPVTPDMLVAQRGGTLATPNISPIPRTASGKMDTTGMMKATPNQPIFVYSSPSLDTQTQLEAYVGMPLFVADRQGEWAQVVLPGGVVGWIPTAALDKRA